MTETVEYVKDGELSVFRVTHKGESTPVFTAVVDEVTGWQEPDGEPAQFEPYFESVMIKWDSCSHYTVAGSGYLHLCGIQDYKRHVALMEWLYKKAFEVMGQPPQPGEDW